jgi:hypothetical protein
MSWIKIEHDLVTSPKFVTVASRLRHGRVTVLGACVTLWMIADKHAVEDRLYSLTLEGLDALVDLPGFGSAMAEVGWIRVYPDCLEVVDYQRHNGPTAKARAMDARRASRYRHGAVTVERDETVTKNKRKSKNKNKELIPPLPPKGDAEQIADENNSAHYDPKTAPLPEDLDTPDFRQAWADWWVYRRERRLPVYKSSTIQQQFREFRQWGVANAITAIRESIRQNYQGLFEPKPKFSNGPPGRPVPDTRPMSERIAEHRAKRATAEFSAGKEIEVKVEPMAMLNGSVRHG